MEFLQNTKTLLKNKWARTCFLNGIGEDEKERLMKMALESKFTVQDITQAYIDSGKSFEAVEEAIRRM